MRFAERLATGLEHHVHRGGPLAHNDSGALLDGRTGKKIFDPLSFTFSKKSSRICLSSDAKSTYSV